MAKTKTKKKHVKRHKVAKGDIVQYYSSIGNVTGTMGEVLGHLSKNEVLVRGIAGDSDYGTHTFVIDPREYDVNNWAGKGQNPYYKYFIVRVVHRVNAKPKKNKSPKARTVHLLETHEQLAAALTGAVDVNPRDHVVLAVTPDDGQTTPPEATVTTPTQETA